jgi:hypothetical protein
MKIWGQALALSAFILMFMASAAYAAEAKIGIRVRLISKDSDEDEFVEYWKAQETKTTIETQAPLDPPNDQPATPYLYDKNGNIVTTLAAVYGSAQP